MAGIEIRHLGDYIRDQRASSNISLRQLARLAGVSNPYLSQIERGLRKPSAEILQQLAKALRISAEALYVQAGILEQRVGDGVVVDAVMSDDGLTERQKQVLLEIYDSFRREDATGPGAGDEEVIVSVVTAPAAPVAAPARRPRKTVDRKTVDRKTVDRKTVDRKTVDRKTVDRKAADRKAADRTQAASAATTDATGGTA